MGIQPSPITTPLPLLSQTVVKAITCLWDELQSELDRLTPSCSACGRCCNFEKFGHQLWITNLELAYFKLFKKLEKPGSKKSCPYLDTEGHCTAREARTLGCRAFYCSSDSIETEELYEKYLNRLMKIAKENGIEIAYGEFLSTLNQQSKNSD
jgi:Fe-S-cluster containining protein